MVLGASGRLVLGSTLFAPLACVTARPRAVRRVYRLHPRVVATLPRALAAEDGDWIAAALPAALGRLTAFALPLRRRTELRLHADRASFARDSGHDEPWLRAWAGYEVVHLLPPRLWRDAGEEARVERLAHELTHAAVFQALGTEEEATRIAPPFWFNEGTCSVVAGQRARRMPLPLAVTRARGRNPLLEGRQAAARDHQTAYAVAHHAVQLLVDDHGADVLARVLDRARADGTRGAVGRAVSELCGVTGQSLWDALRSRAREGDLAAQARE
jgi:hypothetical protein